MNIIGQLQKLGSAIYRLVDMSDDAEVSAQEVDTPVDDDGPGAGGGYLDADSVDIRPASDGPGAGGGYETLVEEAAAEVPSDGPGAGGGYDDSDGDSDGPGAGGGYATFSVIGGTGTASGMATYGGESLAISGYFLSDSANDEIFSSTPQTVTLPTYPRYDLLMGDGIIADEKKNRKEK